MKFLGPDSELFWTPVRFPSDLQLRSAPGLFFLLWTDPNKASLLQERRRGPREIFSKKKKKKHPVVSIVLVGCRPRVMQRIASATLTRGPFQNSCLSPSERPSPVTLGRAAATCSEQGVPVQLTLVTFISSLKKRFVFPRYLCHSGEKHLASTGQDERNQFYIELSHCSDLHLFTPL